MLSGSRATLLAVFSVSNLFPLLHSRVTPAPLLWVECLEVWDDLPHAFLSPSL